MNLAVVGLYFLTSGWLLPGTTASIPASAPQQPPAATAPDSASPQNSDNVTGQSHTQPAPSSGSPQSSTTSTGQAQNPNTPAKPTTKAWHRKKKTLTNCTNAPNALNSEVSPTAPSTSGANAGSSNSASPSPASPAAASNSSAAAKPCPPPKKVVHNGGSNEPAIELVGGTSAQQALDQRSTEELSATTEDNLKKIAGKQLNSSQQDMVAQIQQFMEQSKKAVAAGDPERSHNLAVKAHLLSEELLKP